MRISRREKVVVGLGALVLALLLLYAGVIGPLAEKRKDMAGRTVELEKQLEEMRILAAQYASLRAARERLTNRSGETAPVAPFSYLENLARESGLTGRIESMTPVASTIEDGRPPMDEFDVRLSGIGLVELVRFLYRIESSEAVFIVVNLNIRPRYLNPDLLDVSLRLASPKSG